MADLARGAEAAAAQLAVHDDRAAHPGAEGDDDGVPAPAARAEPDLGPGRGVGVVLHHHRQVEPARDAFPDRVAGQAEVAGQHDAGAVLVDEPGGADPDPGDLLPVALLAQLPDELGDGLREQLAVTEGGGALGLAQDAPLRVDDARGDLGSADVDADRQRHGGTPLQVRTESERLE
ncbi:hypothetical protein GCM10009605_13520 [Nocardiopsis composta]